MTEGIEAGDEEEYLRKYIKELKPKTDIIILSVHQGMPGRQSSIGLTDVEKELIQRYSFSTQCSWRRYYRDWSCSSGNRKGIGIKWDNNCFN